jgi:membrane fusion protein, multidrug efflux system
MHPSTASNPARLACALAVAAALAGCGKHPQAKAPAALPQVSVLTVHQTDVARFVDLPGRTSPFQVAEVRARVDGIVQKRLFTEGADVRAGEPLYRIDPAQYQAQYNSAVAAEVKAEANLAATRAQALRYKDLVASNAVSKQAYDNAAAAAQQAVADVGSAQAAVALARLNLDYTRVAAPIAGRTSTSLVTQGAYVQASAATLLTTIQQLDPIYVDLTEASAEGLRLRDAGLADADPAHAPRVTLTLEDGSTYPLAGKLQFTGTSVDPGTGSVKLRALFANPKGVLLPGMYVRARVQQGDDANALLVPASAVAHDPQGQPTALVVDAAGKVQQRTLHTSELRGADWVVTGGLQAGERVIVSGLQKVQPGMKVSAVEAPAAAPAAAPALAANQH